MNITRDDYRSAGRVAIKEQELAMPDIMTAIWPRFREPDDLTFFDVKDTDPTGAKVPGAILGELTAKARERYG